MIFIQLSFLASLAAASSLQPRQLLGIGATEVCRQIESSITGEVYYPLSLGAQYSSASSHYMSSSSQKPQCVVEPISAQEISTILIIIGDTRIPFAVKSGGHASNAGFSSTLGVQISLAKFKQVILSADKKSAEIGFGNVRTHASTSARALRH